ncbi:hypothetical protein D3C76_1621370 [compost metagenome]
MIASRKLQRNSPVTISCSLKGDRGSPVSSHCQYNAPIPQHLSEVCQTVSTIRPELETASINSVRPAKGDIA